jgi:hypothetical protein
MGPGITPSSPAAIIGGGPLIAQLKCERRKRSSCGVSEIGRPMLSEPMISIEAPSIGKPRASATSPVSVPPRSSGSFTGSVTTSGTATTALPTKSGARPERVAGPFEIGPSVTLPSVPLRPRSGNVLNPSSARTTSAFGTRCAFAAEPSVTRAVTKRPGSSVSVTSWSCPRSSSTPARTRETSASLVARRS